MPASLFNERFIGRREPAWHRLGEGFPADEKMTATDAMIRADIMFSVEKMPQFIELPTGEHIPTTSYSVVREPTVDDPQYRVLATVGKEWTAIQAPDLGKMLDPISERYPVETAGAIGKGEKIFISLDAGESKIAGEDHNLFYLVSDARDGTGALNIAFTPVRVVCQNTLVAGLNNAKVSISIKHNQNIKTDTEFYLDIFSQMAHVKDTVVSAMDSLTSVTIEDDDIKRIMLKAYPNASRPSRLKLSDGISADEVPAHVWTKILKDREGKKDEYEKRQARVDRIKANAMERLDIFNQEFPHLAQTPWAVYNAVVETEDYRRGWDTSDTMLFGSRAEAKVRAFQAGLALV